MEFLYDLILFNGKQNWASILAFTNEDLKTAPPFYAMQMSLMSKLKCPPPPRQSGNGNPLWMEILMGTYSINGGFSINTFEYRRLEDGKLILGWFPFLTITSICDQHPDVCPLFHAQVYNHPKFHISVDYPHSIYHIHWYALSVIICLILSRLLMIFFQICPIDLFLNLPNKNGEKSVSHLGEKPQSFLPLLAQLNPFFALFLALETPLIELSYCGWLRRNPMNHQKMGWLENPIKKWAVYRLYFINWCRISRPSTVCYYVFMGLSENVGLIFPM